MPSYIDFSQVKRSAKIEDFISTLALPLKQKGEQWRGPCIVCKAGGDRAFVITPAKQAWYCFGCKKGGDVISLVAHVKKLDPKDAAHFIAGGRVPVPDDGKNTSSRGTVPEEEARGKQGDRTLQPLAYLEASHEAVQGLGVEAATAQHFGAGYAPKGIMRGRMAIPIHSRTGELLAYCGRSVKIDQQPALIFPNGFKPWEVIYNANRIEKGELYLVRDPLQVLMAYQNGVENVVAFLTETISAEQLEMLAALMDTKGCDSVELI